MAAKVAAVGGIGIGFCHITKSIWVREECNTCFYAKKRQGISQCHLKFDEMNTGWLKTRWPP